MNNSGESDVVELICKQPEIGEKIYDYYNGLLNDAEVSVVERHLIDCSFCEKVILDLDLSLAVLNDQQNDMAVDDGEPKQAADLPKPATKQDTRCE